MSVTFQPVFSDDGRARLRCACPDFSPEQQCAACYATLNLANGNARDLLDWLGLIDRDLWGKIEAPELVRLCELRLKMDYTEEARPTVQRGNVVECGRDVDYILNRCRSLLQIAKMAGDYWVSWS